MSASGYACRTCKRRHSFSAWVHAHWHICINHTCDKCGAKHEILAGHATLVTPGKIP